MSKDEIIKLLEKMSQKKLEKSNLYDVVYEITRNIAAHDIQQNNINNTLNKDWWIETYCDVLSAIFDVINSKN